MFKETLIYLLAKILSPFLRTKNKDMWLISERGTDARDNAYHLTKWLKENRPEVQVTYVISEDDADYEKIKPLCNTVKYKSWEHYKLFVSCRYLVSTHVMGYSPNAYLFRRWGDIFPKIIYPKWQKRVFLQHGVTNVGFPELAANKNHIDLLCCVTNDEYKFFNEEYKWSPDILKQTGFARYDALKDDHEVKKQILIMPTWRRWLLHKDDKEFLQSEYFKAYDTVLKDKGFIHFLKTHGYGLIFYLHSEFQSHSACFLDGIDEEVVTVAEAHRYDVQQLLKESALLVTDHSSVYFDFAYQNKPVVYYQFDNERYYQEHADKGYFNFIRDGFGEVVTTPKTLIMTVDNYVVHDCQVKEKYQKNIDKCFEGVTKDKSICETIYEEIERL